MIAIFDRYCRLVGWFNQENQMIHDTNMRWIGFVHQRSFFTTSCRWCGGWKDGSFTDTNGRVIAWIEGTTPRGNVSQLCPMTPLKPMAPLTPLKPLTPLRPLAPLAPINGWSNIDWESLWKQ